MTSENYNIGFDIQTYAKRDLVYLSGIHPVTSFPGINNWQKTLK